jgi:hypothetical protein
MTETGDTTDTIHSTGLDEALHMRSQLKNANYDQTSKNCDDIIR